MEPIASSGLITLLEKGGFVMAVLLLLSVYVAAVVMWKIFQFTSSKAGQTEQADRALSLIRRERVAEAKRALAEKDTPLNRLMTQAMALLGQKDLNENQRETAIRQAGSTEIRILESRLRSLEMVAHVSPLLGLLGTVIGMVHAFMRLEEAGTRVDAGLLAGGIWEALLTTIGGLVVAIPAFAAYYALNSYVERIRCLFSDYVTRLMTLQKQLGALEEAYDITLPAQLQNSAGTVSTSAAKHTRWLPATQKTSQTEEGLHKPASLPETSSAAGDDNAPVIAVARSTPQSTAQPATEKQEEKTKEPAVSTENNAKDAAPAAGTQKTLQTAVSKAPEPSLKTPEEVRESAKVAVGRLLQVVETVKEQKATAKVTEETTLSRVSQESPAPAGSAEKDPISNLKVTMEAVRRISAADSWQAADKADKTESAENKITEKASATSGAEVETVPAKVDAGAKPTTRQRKTASAKAPAKSRKTAASKNSQKTSASGSATEKTADTKPKRRGRPPKKAPGAAPVAATSTSMQAATAADQKTASDKPETAARKTAEAV